VPQLVENARSGDHCRAPFILPIFRPPPARGRLLRVQTVLLLRARANMHAAVIHLGGNGCNGATSSGLSSKKNGPHSTKISGEWNPEGMF